MTLVVVLRLQHHHQFQLLVWNEGAYGGQDHFLPFMKMKAARAAGEANVPLWNNVNKHIVLALINLLTPLKPVNWRLLMLSSRPMYKVLLKSGSVTS